MIVPEHLVTFIGAAEVAVWIANCDNQSRPDIARPTGVVKGEADDELIIFLPQRNAETILTNIEHNDRLALFGSRVTTFESYQFKGRCVMQRLANDEEVNYQRRLIAAFADCLSEIFSLPAAKVIDAYYSRPIIALTLRVEEIFDQTPRKGTGNRISQEG